MIQDRFMTLLIKEICKVLLFFGVLLLSEFTAFSALTPTQISRAFALTSLFENDTFDLQYDYVENLNDGRGYTAGRGGFTTSSGEVLEVVRRYHILLPGNPLDQFTAQLKKLADEESGSIKGL